MTATALLLPGLDGTGALFRRFLELAPPSIAIQSVSYPVSSPAGLATLAQIVAGDLPTSRFFMVAESFSGPVALRVAASRPTGLTAVVLVNSFITSPVYRGLRLLPLDVVFRRRPPLCLVRRYLTNGDEDVAHDVVDAVARVQPQVVAARIRAILELDGTTQHPGLPTLYIRGKQDRIVPWRCALEIAQRGAALEEVNGPHLLLQAAPAECWSVIVRFLENSIPHYLNSTPAA